MGDTEHTPIHRWKVRAIVVAALLLAVAPNLLAQGRLTVDLRAPGTVRVGGVYEAEFHVHSPQTLPDVYVKISLPTAFQVISGKSSYRGRIAAHAEFVLAIKFKVTGFPSANISGTVIAYDHSTGDYAGKGKTLYCRKLGQEIAISSESTAEEEDRVFKAELESATNGSKRQQLRRKRRQQLRERAIVREATPAQRYSLGSRPSMPLSLNKTLNAVLDPGRENVYQFSGRRGDRLWITVESGDFDPRILLLNPDLKIVAEDDDSAGHLNARIPARGVFELSAEGTYSLVVRSYDKTQSGKFRLKVERFDPITPIAKPFTSKDRQRQAGAAAANVTLSGTIVYNSVYGQAPVRFASAGLYADKPFAADPLVATSQTDRNGNIAFGVPPANAGDSLYIRVLTQDGAQKITSVQDLGTVHSAESFRFVLPNTTNVTFGTWNVAGTGHNGEFTVYEAAVEGYLIATQVLNVTPPLVTVHYPFRKWIIFTKPGDTDAHYQAGEIYIGELYYSSPDVVLHEYGHFIADLYGFRQTQGGLHYVPFHQRVNPSLAWGEGWATFFSVAGQNAMGQSSKQTYESNHPQNIQNYSLENGHSSNMIWDSVAGDDNEGSVQFILWDLFDDSRDWLPVAGVQDTVSIPMKSIFDAARTGAYIQSADGSFGWVRVDYLEKFYDGLIQQNQYSFEQATPIRYLFQDQRIQWEIPPKPPTDLRFTNDVDGIRLRWEAGSQNTQAYLVEQKSPGQADYSTTGIAETPSLLIGDVAPGTAFRVTGLNANEARFTGPFFSAPSSVVQYTGPPPPARTITVSDTTLSIQANAGDTTPLHRGVQISSSDGAAIPWSAIDNAAWLSLNPSSGTTPSTLTISVNPAGLQPGSYSGTVTVSSPGLPSRAIAVTLSVLANPNSPVITTVINGASFNEGFAPGSWVSIMGTHLSRTTRIWRADEIINGRLPTSLDGVSVKINGRPAFVYYISPTQLNVQAPTDGGVGTVEVEVTTPDGVAKANALERRLAPGLFTYSANGRSYAAAVHADGVLIGPENVAPGVITRPVKQGDIILLFATGLGTETTPPVPAGRVVTTPAALLPEVEVLIAGQPAGVLYSGLVSAGLYQINVRVNLLPDGDQPLLVQIAGVRSQDGAFITVRK